MSAQKVDSGEENSPAAPRTRDRRSTTELSPIPSIFYIVSRFLFFGVRERERKLFYKSTLFSVCPPSYIQEVCPAPQPARHADPENQLRRWPLAPLWPLKHWPVLLSSICDCDIWTSPTVLCLWHLNQSCCPLWHLNQSYKTFRKGKAYLWCYYRCSCFFVFCLFLLFSLLFFFALCPYFFFSSSFYFFYQFRFVKISPLFSLRNNSYVFSLKNFYCWIKNKYLYSNRFEFPFAHALTPPPPPPPTPSLTPSACREQHQRTKTAIKSTHKYWLQNKIQAHNTARTNPLAHTDHGK